MNYIWEHAIKVLEHGLDQDDTRYKYGRPFSPYMELSFADINQSQPFSETNNGQLLKDVEINPFYRYHSIFKGLFKPNLGREIDHGSERYIHENINEEVIATIHDITIHHLKDIDVLMGMCLREFYIRFITKDMHDGYFGSYIQKNIGVLSREEQRIVATNLLSLFETGECIYLLKETIRRIFTKAYVFSNAEEKDEIVFFLRTDETDEKWAKIEVIKYIFLPFKCNILIYWERIFGLMGIEEMMKIGETMNY